MDSLSLTTHLLVITVPTFPVGRSAWLALTARHPICRANGWGAGWPQRVCVWVFTVSEGKGIEGGSQKGMFPRECAPTDVVQLNVSVWNACSVGWGFYPQVRVPPESSPIWPFRRWVALISESNLSHQGGLVRSSAGSCFEC